MRKLRKESSAARLQMCDVPPAGRVVFLPWEGAKISDDHSASAIAKCLNVFKRVVATSLTTNLSLGAQGYGLELTLRNRRRRRGLDRLCNLQVG